MIHLPTKSKSPIGLDLGGRVIKAVQLNRVRGRQQVCAWASISRLRPDTPIDRAEAQRLTRVLNQKGFAGRQVVVSAPSDFVMSSVLDMPPRDSGAPYDVIASQEFSRLQSQEPGGFEVAWWDIPQPARSNTTKVMAVGCAHADTDPLLDALTETGLDVVAMDAGLCATVRACRSLLGPPDKISAVLDMGWSVARLGLVHGGVVVFERTFSTFGMAGVHKQVCEKLNLEPAEADCLIQQVGLVETCETTPDADERAAVVAPMLKPIFASYFKDLGRDLEASFEYASHQYPGAEPHRLVLVGGGGAVPGLPDYINTLIEPEAVSADHTESASDDQAAADRHGEHQPTGASPAILAGARGLAGYHDQD